MAGTTLLSQSQQNQQNENDRKLAGETTRYSPWTGLKAGPIRKVDTMGNIMKGAQAGVMAGGMGFGGGGGSFGTGDPSALAAAARTSPLGVEYSGLSEFSGVTPETMAKNLTPTTPMAGGMGMDYSKLAGLAGATDGFDGDMAALAQKLGMPGAKSPYGMDMSKLAKYLKVSPWQSMFASNE